MIPIIEYSEEENKRFFEGHPNKKAEGETFSKKLKFEILEVYQGDKYEDTAITEIYFEGQENE
jgi:hypothetical protein